MKSLTFVLLFLPLIVSAQSSFRVKVVEKGNMNPISKAIVFIEEIPIPDKETDSNGFVFYENIPSDRKVRIHARKFGYLPQKVEVVANLDIGPDNNVLIFLEKESSKLQKIIWGEVVLTNDTDVSGAKVEVNLAGKIFSTKTDESGNYRIKINSEEFDRLGNFRIEVNYEGCKKHRENVPITVAEIVNKDIVLTCSVNNTSSSHSKNTKERGYPVEKKLGDVLVKITDISYTGGSIIVKLKMYNDLSFPTNVGINAGNLGEKSSKMNNQGDIIYSSKAIVGNTPSLGMSGFAQENVSSKAWINCSIRFNNVPSYKVLEILQIYMGYYDNGWHYFPIVLRNLPVN
jgi:hypothetical protein